MLFNSLDFAAFLLVVYAMYLVLPHRGQNVMLLIASYTFYGCWDYRFLSLLFISTVIDFWAALAIERAGDPRKRRRFLAVSMSSNLLMLGFFKYFNFFVGNMEHLLASVGLPVSNLHLNIVLPVGISFYTFQSMSYTIDVYRGELRATRRFFDFALFVSFFPQLVAGPIERASRLLPQVLQPRKLDWLMMQEGCWLMVWGLFKKAVIADNLAVIADRIFQGDVPLTAGSVLLGVYAFAFQIYGDFSGYSDMARGLSKIMGFDLMVNFRNPYFALNPGDFWRRWHISLSTWLRDYLYIPLGGNRRGPRRTSINLMATMLLGGLWHGAAWTFVAWGLFHGTMLVAHRFIVGRVRAAPVSPWSEWLRRFGFFHLVCVSWILFRARSVNQAYDMLATFWHTPSFPVELASGYCTLVFLCMPLWLVQVLEERSGRLDAARFLSLIPKTALLVAILFMLLAFGSTGGHAFIYFQF